MEKLWDALEAIERFDAIQNVAAEIKHDCDLYQDVDRSKFILVLYGYHDRRFADEWLIPRMTEIFKDQQKCNILKPDFYDPNNPTKYNYQDEQMKKDIEDQRCWKVIAVFSSHFPSSNLPQPNGHHESDWVAQAAHEATKVGKKQFLLPIVYSDTQNSSKQVRCCQICTDDKCGGKSLLGDLGANCPRRLHTVVYDKSTEYLFNFWDKLIEPFNIIRLTDDQKIMNFLSDSAGNEGKSSFENHGSLQLIPNGYHPEIISHNNSGNEKRGFLSFISILFRGMTNIIRGTPDVERGEISELAPLHDSNNGHLVQFQTTNAGHGMIQEGHVTIKPNTIGRIFVDEPSEVQISVPIHMNEVSENSPLTTNNTLETNLSINTQALFQNVPCNLPDLNHSELISLKDSCEKR